MPRQKSTHVDSPEAVGRRLKEARERAALSQRALSFTGCSPAYISRIEAGQRIPSLQLLRELGRRLGVTEDYLASGSDSTSSRRATPLLDAEIALRLDEYETAGELYERGLSEATRDEDRAIALEGLGKVEIRRGRTAEAIELLERSLALSGGDPASRPELAEALGRAYGTLGDLAPAIALFERCARHFEGESDPVRYVRFACLLGYALTDSGNFGEAERVVAAALERGRGIKDPYTRARLYWSQSRILVEQGQSALAERYAQRALETLRATEDTHAIAQAHQLLAGIYLDEGRAQEALDLLRESAPLIASCATPIELAHYRIEEARALAALGDREQAASLAMELTGKLGDAEPLETGRAYVLLGEIFAELGEAARAQELYELGVERLEAHGPTRYLVEAYKRLAQLLEAEGRAGEALFTLKRALGVQDRAGRPVA
jgi:tetratricopeptide (TPR) repeat protein